MLASKLYSPTLREIPADAEIASHQYMLKAGMIRKNGGGLYSFLPLGRRVELKIEAIVREEMNNIGAQEIMMPIMSRLKSGMNRAAGMPMARKCSNSKTAMAIISASGRHTKN